MSLDGALIVGGKSSRLGEDKAFLRWNGEALWVVQLRKLLQIEPVEHVWLASNAEQDFPEHIEQVTRVDDAIPEIGPIGALKTVFEKSTSDRVLVLAVDLPLLNREALRRSLTHVPKIAGRWEPLAACYPRAEMLPLIDQQIKAGEYALQRLLDLAEESGLIESIEVGEDRAYLYSNINTKSDWDALEAGAVHSQTMLRRFGESSGYGEAEKDWLAREEPLEVRVNGQSVSVMMRTPGHDDDLATGFLFTEGIITSAGDIMDIEHCPDVDSKSLGNTLSVQLREAPNLDDLTRHVFTSSSCGVCGKATIDSVFQNFPPVSSVPEFDPKVILSLPEKLRSRQDAFEKTGGLHASALFHIDGELLLIREDVGRHNALDKVIGKALRDKMDLSEVILLVSGRISFELIQKALAARIPVIAGISAPSSLAVDMAKESGQVLIGFLRGAGFNHYG